MIEKELIIIGSGPAGLRAGEEAQKAGIDYLILEKGNIAQSWRDIRQDMMLLSPCLPQRDWTSISETFPIWKMDITRPFCYTHEFLDYLVKFCDFGNFNIKTNIRVKSINKNFEYFDITTDSQNYRSKYVLIATGFFGNPFIPDIPGMKNNPNVSHSHQFTSIEAFRNKRVVIIGSGNSAAETAILLSGYAQVYLISRGKLKFFSKTRNLCNIRGFSESLLLEFIDMEIIRHISDQKILKVDRQTLYLSERTIETQAIICATGYNADLSSLGSTQIKVDKKTKFPSIDAACASTSISDLYFAGPLAYRELSSLLIHGFIKTIPDTIKKISQNLMHTSS